KYYLKDNNLNNNPIMKKMFLVLMAVLIGVASLTVTFAQDAAQTDTAASEATADEGTADEATTDEAAATEDEAAAPANEGFHHVIKQKFIEGGWEWMSPVLICLII